MENYRVLKVVGKGTFGKAVLARRKADNRQVIVKKIPMASLTAKEVEETENEVKCLAALQHPYIVPYYDSFREKNAMHIVMGYADSGDLKKKVEEQRGIHFKEDQVLDWFVQISLALKHLHDRKMMHRDLKTENVFMMGNTCMLGDFGIAKVLEHTMAMAATSCGTPIYMSPEVCQDQPYNIKADIWSLGCILYEMCNLQYCFMGRNMKELIFKIVRAKYDPIKSRYSQNVKQLVKELLAVEPDERPQINDLLGRTFLRGRVGRLLTNKQIRTEFGSGPQSPIDLNSVQVGGVDGVKSKMEQKQAHRRSQTMEQDKAKTPAERRAMRRQSAAARSTDLDAARRQTQFPWQAAQQQQPQQQQRAVKGRQTVAPSTGGGVRRIASEKQFGAPRNGKPVPRRQSSAAALGGNGQGYGGRRSSLRAGGGGGAGGGRHGSIDSVAEEDEEVVVVVGGPPQSAPPGGVFSLESPPGGAGNMGELRQELAAKSSECKELRQLLQLTQGRVQQTETKLRVAQDKLKELTRLFDVHKRLEQQGGGGGIGASAENSGQLALELEQALAKASALARQIQSQAPSSPVPQSAQAARSADASGAAAAASWLAIETAAKAARMQVSTAADVAADASRNLRSGATHGGQRKHGANTVADV